MSNRPSSHPPGYKNIYKNIENGLAYFFWVECKNCGHTFSVNIPKGTFAAKYILNIPCEVCKCKALKPS